MKYLINHFDSKYQEQVKSLILSGLEEHWGTLNPNFNSDLNEIANHYKQDIFLIALFGEKIIATGAALLISSSTAKIVRMSVRKKYRRNGIGKAILDALILELREKNISKVILETTRTWTEAISFYTNYGFAVTHYEDEDIYFKLDIA